MKSENHKGSFSITLFLPLVSSDLLLNQFSLMKQFFFCGQGTHFNLPCYHSNWNICLGLPNTFEAPSYFVDFCQLSQLLTSGTSYFWQYFSRKLCVSTETFISILKESLAKVSFDRCDTFFVSAPMASISVTLLWRLNWNTWLRSGAILISFWVRIICKGSFSSASERFKLSSFLQKELKSIWLLIQAKARAN